MDIQKLKDLMHQKSITQTQIAQLLGKSKSGITALMQGTRRLTIEELVKVADYLNVPTSFFLGEVSEHLVPVIGEVPGGDLTLAIENGVEDFITFSTNKKNVCGLRVKGNSMSRIAPDGAYIVVNTDETDAKNLNNKPVVILIDNGFDVECTFKILKTNPLRFEPYSIEAGYDTIYPNEMKWKIFGLAIGTVGFIGDDADLIRKIENNE